MKRLILTYTYIQAYMYKYYIYICQTGKDLYKFADYKNSPSNLQSKICL